MCCERQPKVREILKCNSAMSKGVLILILRAENKGKMKLSAPYHHLLTI